MRGTLVSDFDGTLTRHDCHRRFESGPKTRVGPGHRASGGPRDLAHVVK
jgi:hypothetical protein